MSFNQLLDRFGKTILGNAYKEFSRIDGDDIDRGIDVFPTLADALFFAQTNIDMNTRRDFTLAWYYEAVKARTLERMAL